MGDEIYSNPIARDKELKGRQLGEMKLAYFRAFLAGFLHTPLLPPPPLCHMPVCICDAIYVWFIDFH